MNSLPRTDWNEYYRTPSPAARLLRRITSGRLLAALECVAPLPAGASIVEFGGGGSSFAEVLTRRFPCSSYTAADTSVAGLRLFETRRIHCERRSLQMDVLGDIPDFRADLVFSAGLIEHFSPEDTANAVRAHFRAAKRGGTVALLFPADSVLYRMTRGTAEFFHCWKFPDERALTFEEVERAAQRPPVHSEWIRCILLTQGLMLFRKEQE